MFSRIATWVTDCAGHPLASLLAIAAILLWLLSGPLFGWSDTWQILINTITTVITFLMVFLLQHAQNKDTKAIQKKLDEIVHALPQASNRVIGIERKDES